MAEITVIGLGAMGSALAHNLLAAGHDVIVWNRTPAPAERLAAEGAQVASTLSDALSSGVVFSMLSDDAAVAETFLDSGVLAHAPAGSVHVNLATVSTALARRAARVHADHAVGYVAAPVFGRVPVAEAGQLNILAAGPPDLIDLVAPFLEVIGSRTWVLGDRPEQANATKILGNYLVACVIESLGESIAIAERGGIDPDTLVELLTSTLFPGPVFASYGELIAHRRYRPAGFTTSLGRKDLHLALDAAAEVGARTPFGDVLRDVFEQALAQGRAEDDWAAIVEPLR